MSDQSASQIVFTNYRRPKTIIIRFVAKHSYKIAMLWGIASGLTIMSSAIGFSSLYKTEASRQQLTATFGNNAGLKLIFGTPHKIATIGGFTSWRALGVIVIIMAIWGILVSTRNFRGEEEAGRMELFRTGQTTARRATLNIFAGLAVSVFLIYFFVCIITYMVGTRSDIGFTLGQSLYIGLAVVSPAVMFIAVGALMSQLAPIRKKAAAMTAAVFGISFLTRAVSDVDANLVWLQNFTPLGWVEKLRPLTDPQPIWLLPIFGFSLIVAALAIYLSGHRDLGEGILKDKDSAEPKTLLLGGGFGLAIRESKFTVLTWSLGAAMMGLLYGYIAKTAADAVKGIEGFDKVLGSVTGSRNIGAELFIGILFLIVMVILMLMATNMLGAMRNDEAYGYLDNLLVRPVSRLKWLSGRILVAFVGVSAAGFGGAVAGWIGETSQHVGVPFSSMLTAGLNIMPAPILMISIGVFIFGFLPRLTTSILYGLVAWAFLIEMIGGAVNLNHWILDTSILHHVALAPAIDPNWQASRVIMIISIVLLALGTGRFLSRDIQGE